MAICTWRGQKGKYKQTSGPGDDTVLNENEVFYRKTHFYMALKTSRRYLMGPKPLTTSSLEESGSSNTFPLGSHACPGTAPPCVPSTSGDSDGLLFGEAIHAEGYKRADRRTHCLPSNPSSVIN